MTVIQQLFNLAKTLREFLREPHVIYMNLTDPSRVIRCDELCEEIANALDEAIKRAGAYSEDEVLENLLKQENQMLQARRDFDVETLEAIHNSACNSTCGTCAARSACS
jgi:hypothetical protein